MARCGECVRLPWLSRDSAQAGVVRALFGHPKDPGLPRLGVEINCGDRFLWCRESESR